MDKERFHQVLAAMIEGVDGLSDLLFIPGRAPQMARHDRLYPYQGDLTEPLVSADLTREIALIIMDGNERFAENLRVHGSCDCSYVLPGGPRFRVNIYRESGSLAIVMRKLPSVIPELDQLGLPPVLREKIIKEQNGLIFVTGATRMGKTTTLAALLNELNQTQDIHIITLEDPIEFLHTPNRATFSQRELGKDFFNYSVGLRAALRQAPRAILVGEIRDRETMEVAITAAETGHVVFTTLHTIDASQTINRILGMFAREDEQLVRQRLADTLRWVVSQRLVSKVEGGLHLVTEIMGNNLRSREVILLGESEKRNLHEIIESSVTPYGWNSFEQSLLKAYQEGHISRETAVLHSTHKSQIGQAIDIWDKTKKGPTDKPNPSARP